MEKSSPAEGTPKTTAHLKVMDLLARREHTEKEIREKLDSSFPPDQIQAAIQFAKKNRWLPDSEESLIALAEKTAMDLRRRGKGSLYINEYLEQKGLPKVFTDIREELEKARALVKNKFSHFDELVQSREADENASQKAKMARFLSSRGFDMDIVRKVIYGED